MWTFIHGKRCSISGPPLKGSSTLSLPCPLPPPRPYTYVQTEVPERQPVLGRGAYGEPGLTHVPDGARTVCSCARRGSGRGRSPRDSLTQDFGSKKDEVTSLELTLRRQDKRTNLKQKGHVRPRYGKGVETSDRSGTVYHPRIVYKDLYIHLGRVRGWVRNRPSD